MEAKVSKIAGGGKEKWKKGVCCLPFIHVTFFTRVEDGGLNVGWVSKATECC